MQEPQNTQIDGWIALEKAKSTLEYATLAIVRDSLLSHTDTISSTFLASFLSPSIFI